MRFEVEVPATTANLGPGFDGLGMALNLCNVFTISAKTAGANTIVGSGTCREIRGGSNIFFSAMRRVARHVKRAAPKVDVEVFGRVRVARGLGSSATAIVAGVMAADHLLGSSLSDGELLNLAAAEEGHPDNVAPALLGALTASAIVGRKVVVHRCKAHRSWRLAMLIPSYAVPTEKARRAIPERIPHRDAVFNLTRVPLVIEALTSGDAEMLALVLEDRLHEPYRKSLIESYEAIRKAATRTGATAVYLSGAGPTMAAICVDEETARRACEAMRSAAARRSGDSEAIVLKPRAKGATIREL